MISTDDEILIKVFETSDGKRALKRLEDMFCGRSFTKDNPHMTSLKEGRRDVVLTINEIIQEYNNGR